MPARPLLDEKNSRDAVVRSLNKALLKRLNGRGIATTPRTWAHMRWSNNQ